MLNAKTLEQKSMRLVSYMTAVSILLILSVKKHFYVYFILF